MPRPPTSPLQRFGFAITLVAAATVGRAAMGSALGQRQPFATFYIALILAAWYGGLGPSVLALILGGLSALYFFVAPIGEFAQKAAGLLPDALAERAVETIGVDRLNALQNSFDSVRRGGTV